MKILFKCSDKGKAMAMAMARWVEGNSLLDRLERSPRCSPTVIRIGEGEDVAERYTLVLCRVWEDHVQHKMGASFTLASKGA